MTGPSGSPPDMDRRAREILAQVEQQERRARTRTRKPPSLPVVLVPLWAWALGFAFLPDTLPRAAWALFCLVCWAGFAGLAFTAWRLRDQSPRTSQRVQDEIAADIARALAESGNRPPPSALPSSPPPASRQMAEHIARVKRARARSEDPSRPK